jgi:uncharacterized membrane protein
MQVFAYGRGSAEFDRGVSFFDAVYGFAITLLITTVHLPPAHAWRSIRSLLDSSVGPELFAFALSFAVIAVFWRLNYRLIGTMSGMTPRIVFSNIVCTFFIVLIPFSTEGLTASVPSGYPLPTALYAANLAAASLAQTVMYTIAAYSGLTPKASRTRLRTAVAIVGEFVFPAVFVVSIVVAYADSPQAARNVWLSLIVLFPLLMRIGHYLDKKAKAEPAAPASST